MTRSVASFMGIRHNIRRMFPTLYTNVKKSVSAYSTNNNPSNTKPAKVS
jgi:hypothetical protein